MSFHSANAASIFERRTNDRIKVECPAIFETLGGEREVRLVDLSISGAKLTCHDGLAVAASGMLRWQGFEYFCSVVWARDHECGVHFERPLPRSVVQESAGKPAVEAGPAANPSRIPLGRKRARLVPVLD